MTSCAVVGRPATRFDDLGEIALSLRDLRRELDGHNVVRGITLSVRRGEVYGLFGPAGAGKTTTLELIAGVRRAAGGSVEVFGHDLARDPATARMLLGVPARQSDFYDQLTLAEQLRYLGEGFGVRVDPKSLLRRAGLEDRAGWKVTQLALADQGRFALAAALVNDPPLLLLDQPSTGLTAAARRDRWRWLRTLCADGHTLLVATDDPEEAARCDRVAVLDRGQIAGIGAPAALVERMRTDGFPFGNERQEPALAKVFRWLTGYSMDEPAPRQGRHDCRGQG